MPDPRRRKHRTWFIAWAVLCAAGLAATEALTHSPPADADCADHIAEVEARVADLSGEADLSGTAVVWTGSPSGTDDCLDELRDHFHGG
ncbi:hypothetical protein ACFWHF_13480 [Streptomyces griseoincarnatus]|uniref:hypothetical protein n=1 Tax=Streptomyces sp. TRM75561 TaxID=2975269 RepID=UPI00244CEB8F|nr:hypothetical protein [Streptomyces sp. TRM75561]MDH3037312.1 hypothetical protein [Streptomyces sp. TRM75561]